MKDPMLRAFDTFMTAPDEGGRWDAVEAFMRAAMDERDRLQAEITAQHPDVIASRRQAEAELDDALAFAAEHDR